MFLDRIIPRLMLFGLVIMIAHLQATLDLQPAVDAHHTCNDGVICIILLFVLTVHQIFVVVPCNVIVPINVLLSGGVSK